jgi:sulfate permease, SulP family
MRWVSYDISNLRGDLFGVITAGIIALPLALAFGVQSGLGAIAGLYGAIGLGISLRSLAAPARKSAAPRDR